jgi:hypothetical protein
MTLGQIADCSPQDLLETDAAGRPTDAVVAIDADASATEEQLVRAVRVLTECRAIVVVAGSHGPDPRVLDAADICLTPSGGPPTAGVTVDDAVHAIHGLRAAVNAHPVAALSLAWLLRGSDRLSVRDALVMESATYSMLLAGSEFASWLRRRGAPRPADDRKRIRLARTDDTLTIALARPARRNAMDALMRDALVEALAIAEADPLLQVELRAEGPAFSAGGDLDEFGTATDVALAHLVRTLAGPGAAIDRISDRVTARVHGLCAGAGVEVPAFAGHVVADADAAFVLPELSMGLIPGAGGTVSIPRRIGRHRTLWLALSGTRIDAATSVDWGLVDAIG